MKKLIAVLAMFALVGSVVFAEVNVSAYVETRADVIRSADIGGKDEIVTQGDVAVGRFMFSGQNDEGTFGAFLRFGSDFGSGAAQPDHAYAWWQPVEQFRFWLGYHDDGMFESSGNAAWGFHQGTQNGVVNDPGYNYNGFGFAGNHKTGNGYAYAFIIKPIDGLTINISNAIGSSSSTPIGDALENTIFAQLVYNLDGVGDFYVTYDGDGNQWMSNSPHQLGLAFHTNSLVDNLSFGLGFTYILNWDDDGPFPFWDSNVTYKTDFDAIGPIAAALYAYYTGGDWGVKVRGRISTGDSDYYDGIAIQADFMPWYNFGNFEARFNVRIQTLTGDADFFGYSINPYLIVPVGPGKFSIGFEYADIDDTGNGEWRLPVGLQFSF